MSSDHFVKYLEVFYMVDNLEKSEQPDMLIDINYLFIMSRHPIMDLKGSL